MPQKLERYYEDEHRNSVRGRFHQLKGVRETNPPMYHLCTLEEADFKIEGKRRRRRSDDERENFLDKLYAEKLLVLPEKLSESRVLIRGCD